jgi:hypothetical protein
MSPVCPGRWCFVWGAAAERLDAGEALPPHCHAVRSLQRPSQRVGRGAVALRRRGGAGVQVVGGFAVPAGCRKPRQASQRRRPGAAGEPVEERFTNLARPRRLRPLDDAPVQRLGGVRVAGRLQDAGELYTRKRGEARLGGRLGHDQRPPTELLGLARVPARERVRAESDQGEGDVVGKANSPRELEGAPVGVLRGTRFVSPLSNPGLQQHRGNHKDVVPIIRDPSPGPEPPDPKGDASGATPGDRLPNKARAGLAGIAAVLLPMMDDGCWHRRKRAPSGVILAMREEMSGSTLKR